MLEIQLLKAQPRQSEQATVAALLKFASISKNAPNG